jgi:hypothetical protein
MAPSYESWTDYPPSCTATRCRSPEKQQGIDQRCCCRVHPDSELGLVPHFGNPCASSNLNAAGDGSVEIAQSSVVETAGTRSNRQSAACCRCGDEAEAASGARDASAHNQIWATAQTVGADVVIAIAASVPTDAQVGHRLVGRRFSESS